MKKTPILTVIYFLLSAIVIFCVFVKTNQSNFTAIENRTLTTINDLKGLNVDAYGLKELQNKINNLINDQFPEKETINKTYIMTDKLRSDIIGYLGKDLKPFLIPVGTANRISGTDYYCGDVLERNDFYDTLIENRIFNFDKIYEKYGDKYKMYIYKPATVEETNLFDSEYVTSYGEQYWQEFYSSLEGRYKVKRQEINTLDDYKKIHYATDHHWNYVGAYNGYKDIINMISEDFEDVLSPYEMTNLSKRNVEFYGSTSIHNEFCLGYDDFITYDIDYDKDFTIYIDGEEVEQLGLKDEALDNPEEYIYEGYYGNNEKVIKIINNNCNNNKTLLVFGDSFSNSINEDIAAHFKKTYIIDTRYIHNEDTTNTTFSLDSFLEENDVDCMLWLQFYTSLYFDTSCYLHIDLND